MRSKEAVKSLVNKSNGRLVKGKDFCAGDYYEFKALFDDGEDVDSFINNNDIISFGCDFEKGRLTLWFN